jgi:predicted transcriptional regulator
MIELKRLRNNGLSITKISDIMGISYYIISKRLKEIN